MSTLADHLIPEPLSSKLPLEATEVKKLNSFVVLLTVGVTDQECPAGILSFTTVIAYAAVLKV